MVKISVIVPSYNNEKFIKKCLDSILNQTFKDMEIICIDDKSTDKTLHIINEYALKDSRIKVYQNEKNNGIAYTRNRSLKLAKGKYLYFLDSDDYIELYTLEKLYNLAEDKSLDLIIFKMLNFKNLTGRKYKRLFDEMYYLERLVKDNVFTFEDVKEFAPEMCVNLQGKFFKRELIQDIKFLNGYIFEDVPFFLEALIKSERTYFLLEHLCHKRDRRNSIMTTFNKKYLDYIDIMFYVNDVARAYGKYEELKPYLYQHIIHTNQYMLSRLGIGTKWAYYEKMKKDYILHKEIEDVYDELYYKYQAIYDSTIKSNNFITQQIRISYLFLKNKKKVWEEEKIERSMWHPR